jgi:glycosyltransferase involved in cell wall biosynthesis
MPAYNEGAVLSKTVDEVLNHGFTVVVVDDGSCIPASRYLQSRPVHYLRHLTNLGQGAALQTGMQYALSNWASVVVHFDADGQHSAEQIHALIEPIRCGECDVVMGSRFIDPNDRRQVPFLKRLVLKAGVCVSWIFAGLWLTDTHNGFRALSHAAARRIRLTENGYAHATEILELIRKSGLRYKEIPATVRYTEHSLAKGQSMLNSVNILFDLVARKLVR